MCGPASATVSKRMMSERGLQSINQPHANCTVFDSEVCEASQHFVQLEVVVEQRVAANNQQMRGVAAFTCVWKRRHQKTF